MKKLLIIFLCIALCATIVTAATVEAPDIALTLLSQTPDPIEPGEVVKLKFQIENNGQETTEDVIIELEEDFPYSIYRGKARQNIGKLRASSSAADAKIVTFEVKIDEGAVEKNAPLDVKIFIGTAGYVYDDGQFTVDIQTRDAVLAITDVQSTPNQIPPGETGDVEVMVKNLGDSLFRDLRFKLELNGIPLAPYQSSSEQRLSQLDGSFQATIKFSLIADPSASPGLYKVPLNISYNDERGNAQNVEEILAVKIGETPKLRVFVKKSTVQQAKKEGTVTIGVANAGTTDIKFLEIILQESENYQLVSPTNYFYIGDVDSDDTESEDIHIFVNNVDELSIPLQLKYYDANNKPFQQQIDLELDLFSSSQLKKFGIVEKSNAWIFIIILLLAGGGYWYWRRRKKAKKP